MSLIVQVPPTLEPVSLSEMKTHLRVDISDDDGLIETYISAARWNLEETYRLSMLTQTLQMGLDYFGQPDAMPTWLYGWPPSTLTWGPTGWMLPTSSVIELRPPVQSISSITYLDPSGATQTLASSNYVLDGDSWPARVAPNLGKLWPVTAPLPNAVKITFVAGYTSPVLVPDYMRAAVRLWVGHLYEHREQVMVDKRIVALTIPYGVEQLMSTRKTYLLR